MHFASLIPFSLFPRYFLYPLFFIYSFLRILISTKCSQRLFYLIESIKCFTQIISIILIFHSACHQFVKSLFDICLYVYICLYIFCSVCHRFTQFFVLPEVLYFLLYYLPQHFLYFLPLPHGHGSLGYIFTF